MAVCQKMGANLRRGGVKFKAEKLDSFPFPLKMIKNVIKNM